MLGAYRTYEKNFDLCVIFRCLHSNLRHCDMGDHIILSLANFNNLRLKVISLVLRQDIV